MEVSSEPGLLHNINSKQGFHLGVSSYPTLIFFVSLGNIRHPGELSTLFCLQQVLSVLPGLVYPLRFFCYSMDLLYPLPGFSGSSSPSTPDPGIFPPQKGFLDGSPSTMISDIRSEVSWSPLEYDQNYVVVINSFQ